MINQTIKNIYFATIAKLSIFSFLWCKFILKKKHRGLLLQLGSGKDYINGMLNIDGNIFAKKDVWLDLKFGLPFEKNSIKGIYISHTLEHFNIGRVKCLLEEFYRVLEPNGFLRIVVPSLEYAILAWNNKDIIKFSDWPEKFDSIGGRFNNFILCDNQHLSMFDFSFLQELLTKTGFINVYKMQTNKSDKFSLEHLKYEYKGDPNLDSSLYVECQKQK